MANIIGSSGEGWISSLKVKRRTDRSLGFPMSRAKYKELIDKAVVSDLIDVKGEGNSKHFRLTRDGKRFKSDIEHIKTGGGALDG